MRLFIDILFFQCLLPFLLLVIATNPIDVDALKVAHQKTHDPNIKRQLNIRNDEAPGSTYAYLDCNEEDSRSKLDWCKPGKGIIGYTWDGLGWFWIAYYVVPCPLFFDLDKTNDLTQQTERANGKPYVPSIIDNSVDSPGATYFHETYRVVERHMESYTLAATALYVQQVCHLQSPRVSYRVAPPAIQAPNGDLKDSKYRATGLEYPPPGWKARFSNSTINSTEDRRLPRPDPKSGLKWADPNYRMQRPHDEQYDTGQLPPVWITDSPLAVLGDPC
ncbi:hypothetical protein MMC17_009602 [Xylographa soralifera]|nr:hypothetical protein [Xylographa soralifera]